MSKLTKIIFLIFLGILLNCFYTKAVFASCSWYGSCGTPKCNCVDLADCHGCCINGSNDTYNFSCVADESCSGGNCWGTYYICDFGDSMCSGGTCFTASTPISTPSGQTAIKDLKVGDEVKSYDEVKDEESIGLVEKIYETTRSAYYKITTASGKEIEVTAEHPLYAIRSADKQLSFWEYLKTKSITAKLVEKLTGSW